MTKEDLTTWFVEKVAEESGLEISQIKPNTTLSNFNLDSLSTVTIAYDLEMELGVDIDPTLFYEYDTIEKLVEKISTDIIPIS
ncbi:MAG: acyl carrier protein [Bacteroidota bacterium]